ncbi:MAG: AtpZ/AtpI family protein [Ignavibacteriales bacterium]|nr:AtpZ/AtpI family protein [Ignavibacteriales bacterium]
MPGPQIEKDEDKKSSYFSSMRKAGPLFGSGVQLAASVVIMFFLGKWADSELDTKPWMMLIGIFFGTTAGLYNFFKTVNRIEKGNNELK